MGVGGRDLGARRKASEDILSCEIGPGESLQREDLHWICGGVENVDHCLHLEGVREGPRLYKCQLLYSPSAKRIRRAHTLCAHRLAVDQRAFHG